MKRMNENAKRNRIVKYLLGVGLSALLITAGVFGTLFFGNMDVHAATEPSDYGLGENATEAQVRDYLTSGGVGIVDEGNKIYRIESDQGFVTLARLSRFHTFEGYTFRIYLGTGLTLNTVDQDKTTFFGIGGENTPFQGTIALPSDITDSTYLKLNGWGTLFNYLSNRASIVAAADFYLCADSSGPFSLCDTLIVTEENLPLNISGFRFSDAGVVAQKTAGLVAGTVKKSDATHHTVSMDLSEVFSTADSYRLTVENGVAGGLFGVIDEGVDLTVTLGHFNANVSAENGNAGLLVGTNQGSLTIANTAITLSGSVTAGGQDHSAGIVGENAVSGASFRLMGTLHSTVSSISGAYAGGLLGKNAVGAEICTNGAVSVASSAVTGTVAGGFVGESNGSIVANEPVTVSGVSVSGNSATAVLGGAVGRADTAPAGSYLLSNLTFGAGAGLGDSVASMGGFVGELTAADLPAGQTAVPFDSISVTDAIFDLDYCSVGTQVGAYFGKLTANVPVVLSGSGSVDENRFRNIQNGSVGGIVGVLTGSAGLTIQNQTVEQPFSVKNNMANGAFAEAGAGNANGGVVGTLADGAYLHVSHLSVYNTTYATKSGIADLVGICEENTVLWVEELTYRSSRASVLVSETKRGSVFRLTGNVQDLSGSFCHIVRKQDNSLIFADGAGFSFTAGSRVGNEIGNYGQVIRNDQLSVIGFDESTHTVSVPGVTGVTDITLASAADIAKLAIFLSTEGAFGGVDGNPTATYSDLMQAGVTLSLTADISLHNTGIEQLTRADRNTAFAGTIAGGGHTLTLAIGEDINGVNRGVLGTGNERRYLGLFSVVSGATVQGMTVNGVIDYRASIGSPTYLGGVAGLSQNAVALRSCTSSVQILLSCANASNLNQCMVAGGFLGRAEEATLTMEDCTIRPTITHSGGTFTRNARLNLGGAVGEVEAIADGSFKRNLVSTTIAQNVATANAFVGGCFADFKTVSDAGYVALDFSGTRAVGATIYSDANSGGGLIGHTIRNCHIALDQPWGGNVTNAAAADSTARSQGSLGGLINTMRGKLSLQPGFTFSGTFSANGYVKGFLLGYGDTAIVTIGCDPDALSGVTADGFDLFVGQNVLTYDSNSIPATGGILSIETGAETGEIPVSSLWFDQISAQRSNNRSTRYYFNLAALETTAHESTVSTQADLIYWHIYHYVQGSVPAYVIENVYPVPMPNITDAGADISMVDYCFYPTKAEGVLFSFGNRLLTFGRSSGYGSTQSESLPAQMSGLQYAVFSDLVVKSDTNAGITIEKIRLAGRSYGAAALVSGRIEGTRSGSVIADAELDINHIFFYGLTMENNNSALMIHSIGSNVQGLISSVSQYDATCYNQADKTANAGGAYYNVAANGFAAASLIKNGGIARGDGTASVNISIRFKDIVFDGTVAGCIFRDAILIHTLQYNGAGIPFTYNFNSTDDWNGNVHICAVTYGAELATNEKQQSYYDQSVFIRPDLAPSASNQLYTAFGTDYRVYVLVGAENISVNRKVLEFDGGWGTYEHPYQISTPGQLVYLSNLLAAETFDFPSGWKIGYPKANQYTEYDIYVGNGTSTLTKQGGGGTLSSATLLSYLRSAYFQITVSEIELTADFNGIGDATRPFHGVIAGQPGGRTTLIMPDKENIDNTGFGLINVANGCAVTGLVLRYSNVGLKNTKTDGGTPFGIQAGGKDQVTSLPNQTSATTGLVHFGGVIAWIIGGDNRIENVFVSVETVEKGFVTSVFGGYVGLISGGGVIFSGTGAGVTVPETDSYLYYNPYVGRILFGYAFATDASYTETKNVAIPQLNFDRYQANLTANGSQKVANDKTTFTLENAQDLLMFSWAMDSGAFYYNAGNSLGYGKGAFSRRGNYVGVGSSVISCGTLTGGRYIDDTTGSGENLFLTYFGSNCKQTYNTENIDLNLTGSEYDLSAWPNAFRGLCSGHSGGSLFNIRNVRKEGEPAVIRLNMDIRQYYNGQTREPDSRNNLAFVTERKNAGSSATFENIELGGIVSLQFVNFENQPATKRIDSKNYCVAGLIAYVMNGRYFNVSLNELTVISPDWAGGLSASQEYNDNLPKSNNVRYGVKDCSVINTTVVGKRSTGGLFAYLRLHGSDANAPVFANVTVADSQIRLEISQNTAYSENNDYVAGNDLCVGALVGISQRRTLKLSDIVVNKCAVAAICSDATKQENLCAGGLIGRMNAAVTATNCTVDGCVIFAGNTATAGVLPTDYGTTAPISTSVYEKLTNALAHLLANSENNKFCGVSGGFVGINTSTFTATNCIVKSDLAPTILLGFDEAAGVAGCRVKKTSVDLSISDCQITATTHPLYIIGRNNAAGVSGWCVYTQKRSTFAVTNTKVSGNPNALLFILGTANNAGAGGLFGNIGNADVLIDYAEVAYSVIHSSGQAAGAIRALTSGSVITAKNLYVLHSFIQGRTEIGGVLDTINSPAENSSSTVEGVYFGDNVLRCAASSQIGLLAHGGDGIGKTKFYYVLMKNNDAGKAANLSPTDLLGIQKTAEKTAETVLLEVVPSAQEPDKVGVLFRNGANGATVFCLSVEPGNGTYSAKHTLSGTASVLYVAYGAPSVFADAYGTEHPLTPKEALDAVTASAVQGDDTSLSLRGDAQTVTAGKKTPEFLYDLSWWGPWRSVNPPPSDQGQQKPALPDIREMRELEDDIGAIVQNNTLPVLRITGNTDLAITEYLRLITGGGIADAGDNTYQIQSGFSTRYFIGSDGRLEKGMVMENGVWIAEAGSISYTDGKFVSNRYDIISPARRTVSVLTITFVADGRTYSMDIVVFNPQILNVITGISPMEGEVYQVSSFGTSTALTTPGHTLDISAGSAFSLYLEYVYNQAANEIGGYNFGKKIYSSTNDQGQLLPGMPFYRNTEFYLIDLNGTPADYRFFYFKLNEESVEVDLADFVPYSGSGAFSPQLLDALVASGVPSHIWNPTEGEDFTVTAVERYILIVFSPVDQTSRRQYNLQALVKENDRNIEVRSIENRYSVAMWENEAGIVSMTGQSHPFSNKEAGTLTATVTVTQTFTDGYYGKMQGRPLYGTHAFHIEGSDNRTVRLPAGTIVTWRTTDGTVLKKYRTDSSVASITYEVDDVLESAVKVTGSEEYAYSDTFTVTFEFTTVPSADFITAFPVGTYVLYDEFYLSGDREHYRNGVKCEATVSYSTEAATPVKISLIPQNRKHLGINLGDLSEETNDGVIDFDLVVDFSAVLNASIDRATVSFSLDRKQTGATHRYENVADMSQWITLVRIDGFDASTESDSLLSVGADKKGTAKYRLSVDLAAIQAALALETPDLSVLTNYRLVATVTGIEAGSDIGGQGSETHTASDFFVFLVCDLDNRNG